MYGDGDGEDLKLPEIFQTQLMFHDFDYINPISKKPEGTVDDNDLFFPKLSFK